METGTKKLINKLETAIGDRGTVKVNECEIEVFMSLPRHKPHPVGAGDHLNHIFRGTYCANECLATRHGDCSNYRRSIDECVKLAYDEFFGWYNSLK